MKKKGFTLIELLVVIAIIAMLMAILMPALGKVRRLAQRLICGTNLKGLGTAMMVYANDNSEEYPVAGVANSEWATFDTQADYWDDDKTGTDRLIYQSGSKITVSASLYLLVREADVSPKQFVCQSSDQKEFTGVAAKKTTGGQKPDLTMLFDFGGISTDATADNSNEWPANCVSYAYQFPYTDIGATTTVTKAPVSSTSQAGMAIMADRNPWLDPTLTISTTATKEDYLSMIDQLNSGDTPDSNKWDQIDTWKVQVANAGAHMREGQNVLFNDGHTSFEKRPDVGVQNDNIYTQRQTAGPNFTEVHTRIGDAYTSGVPGKNNINIKATEDNVLVNDAKSAGK